VSGHAVIDAPCVVFASLRCSSARKGPGASTRPFGEGSGRNSCGNELVSLQVRHLPLGPEPCRQSRPPAFMEGHDLTKASAICTPK
jgi:hypothetical protein